MTASRRKVAANADDIEEEDAGEEEDVGEEEEEGDDESYSRGATSGRYDIFFYITINHTIHFL